METRPFGKTGEMMPILSLGCQRLVDEEGCSEEQAVAILNTAIDRGIRYYDTAWVYSAGESERRVGLVAKDRRDEMWIATKVRDETADGARRQLEDSLRRLQTDRIDEWRLHNVMTFDRLDAMTGKGGALEALIEAKEQGVVKHLSISGHTDPQIQIEALRRFDFETVLVAVSVLDHFIYSFAEEFLPVAREKNVGVIGMKVFAYKRLTPFAREALRYSLGLPLTTCIVGCSTMEQLKMDLDVAEHFKPMTGAERLEFFNRVFPQVQPQNMPWKANDWNRPTGWAERKQPKAA